MVAQRDASWSPLLDPAAFSAARYDRLGHRIGALLGSTHHDIALVPGEAVVALEAVARELGGGGGRVLNVATSVYGHLFGQWLAAGGATVTTLTPSVPGQPIPLAEVTDALDNGPWAAIALVHGEAASGIVNPLAEILAAARSRGVPTVVDAVASVGAEPVLLGDEGPDILVIGAQKALGGPSGLAVAAVSETGWGLLARPAGAPSFSSLSLLDLKRDWLDTDRTAIPLTPITHDLWALEAAVADVEDEGLGMRVARHRAVARAVRAGLAGLGLRLWVDEEERSSGLTTAALLPDGVDRSTVLALARDRFGVVLGTGSSEVDPRLVKISHTGPRAAFVPAAGALAALAGAIELASASGSPRLDLGAGMAAFTASWIASTGGAG
ncbi:aminotransferase class V-fold PLP-dependent enzyme [Herbiconiux moechotypicola]|uniref:Alanine--glyoxylate aminotransferase family protein n=1 Tax=Herbiconiux moechotypicola TaxID=637393 RepID=A0ABN3D965_9MICO|nr:aminotransferase class V-fold PLP-dependent enzyme [Herbiconiux moechotypicola]MCS5728164.1 aminotransferase class V-fold PLP-dependent enzyme [Herbiconiux moechotypicola]